ncbi:hypothetical protein V6767_20030 [Martelella sp. FLE1502]
MTTTDIPKMQIAILIIALLGLAYIYWPWFKNLIMTKRHQPARSHTIEASSLQANYGIMVAGDYNQKPQRVLSENDKAEILRRLDNSLETTTNPTTRLSSEAGGNA